MPLSRLSMSAANQIMSSKRLESIPVLLFSSLRKPLSHMILVRVFVVTDWIVTKQVKVVMEFLGVELYAVVDGNFALIWLISACSFHSKNTVISQWTSFRNQLVNIIVVRGELCGGYRKVASSNTSRLEAHVSSFRLLMKGIFGPYVLWPFDKKLIS